MATTDNLDDILGKIKDGAKVSTVHTDETPDEFIERVRKDTGKKLIRPKTVPVKVAEDGIKAYGKAFTKVLCAISHEALELVELHEKFEKQANEHFGKLADYIKLGRELCDTQPILAKSDDGDDDTVGLNLVATEKKGDE